MQIFHEVAYKAKQRSDLLDGVDEFLDSVTVLPPGEWDPNIRIEPPSSIPSQQNRIQARLPVDSRQIPMFSRRSQQQWDLTSSGAAKRVHCRAAVVGVRRMEGMVGRRKPLGCQMGKRWNFEKFSIKT